MTNIELCDLLCPECGSHPTRSRTCESCWGEGQHDLYEEDPILHPYGYGRKYRTCRNCTGKGILQWCPECGCDLTSHDGELDWPSKEYDRQHRSDV